MNKNLSTVNMNLKYLECKVLSLILNNATAKQSRQILYNCKMQKVQLPVPVAARSKVVRLRPFANWNCGFESYQGHGCLSVVSVVCCQVEVFATSWSLVQRSPTDCGASLLWSRNLVALARWGLLYQIKKCKTASFEISNLCIGLCILYCCLYKCHHTWPDDFLLRLKQLTSY
jgi:hypothetical protein